MTGFEVAGIVLGVLPLIITAFDRIQTFLAEYDGLDQQLQRSRRDILTIQGLFKDAINSLLSDVLEQDRQERMLKNPQSEDWNLEFLDEDQRTVLGEALQPVLNSIEGFKEAIQEYEGVLLNLCKAHPMKRLAKTIASAASVMHSTTSGSGSGVRIDDTGAKILSSRDKVRTIRKNTTGKLRLLYLRMKGHHEALQAVMTSRTYRVIKQTQTSAFSTSARFVNATANSACKMLVDPRKTQTASIKLHGILCNTQPSFRCSCHLLHLCLDIKNEKPQPKNLKGTPGTVKLETEFLFLMTTTSKPGSKSASQSMMQLVFTSKEIESASAELNSISKTCDTLCEELLASNEEYERYLWSPGHNQDNSGFVLRRTLPPESLANINSMVSLDHLISTTEIDQLDRYQIAASLASSVLSFYSSPWVRDLTLETIQFLDKAAESTSLWTPHIPVKFSSDNHQFGTRNREIYALGLILLQLGQGRRLCSTNGEAEEERVLLKNALRDASRKVGRRYKQVVENCLFKWSDMNLDLMEEGHAAAFRTDIEVLERLVADF